MAIVEYHEDGRIDHVMTIYPASVPDDLRARGARFLVVDDDVRIDPGRYFVRDELVCLRPAMMPRVSATLITMGGEAAVIEDLPDPCTAHIIDEMGEAESHAIEGGRLEFAGADPGRYRLVIEAWPYMPKEIEIAVRAPLAGEGQEQDMWGDDDAA